MDTQSQLVKIKRAYATVLPEWIKDYQTTGNMRHDPYVIDWRFNSPIQRILWGDIRAIGLPFYPTVPARGYFIEFANPFLKIGIESNGRAWFNDKKARIRNKCLAADGWMIFRLAWHEFKPVSDLHSAEDEESSSQDLYQYYMTTSEGLLRAINWAYFGGIAEYDAEWMIRETLRSHRSTPETTPYAREVVRRQRGPKLIGDLMPEYLELLEQRSVDRPQM